MSVNFNPNSTGMDNAGTNLFRQAIDLAKDGNLSAADMKKLQETAFSDGTASTAETNFLESLKTNGADFVAQVKAASAKSGFDPSTLNWDVKNLTVVQSASGKDITLAFSDQPKPSKKVDGNIGEAQATLTRLAGSQADRWRSIDPHNIADVKAFVASLNLSTADKMQFAQAYLTANYNHPGIDIAWNGAGLQEGIDAVPKDANGRKYLDCEAYLETARQVTGLNISPYALDADGSGSRNHQVGVFREGDKAYVLSNNEVQTLDINGRDDKQLIQAAYKDFDNITEDLSGPMKVGTEVLTAGETLPNDASVKVLSITNGSTAVGIHTDNLGNKQHVAINFNTDSGQFKTLLSPAAGDVLVDGSGKKITMQNGTQGTIQLSPGRTAPVTVTVAPDGNWHWNG